MALTKISGEVIQQPINIGVITATSVTATSATFSDNVSIGAGATTAFFEVDTGNVGIGTDNPFYKLEVRGDTNTEIRIGNFDDSEAGILLSNVGSTNRRIVASGGDMIFRGGASTSDEHVRIDSSGNVGIGTDNPATEFHVQDGSDLLVALFESPNNHVRLRIKSSSSSLGQLEFADDTDADAGEIRYAHSTDKMTFHVGNNTERVGITSESDGTSNLEIANGNLVFSTSGTGIDFQNAGISSTTAASHVLDDYEEGTWTPTLFRRPGGTGGYEEVSDAAYSTDWNGGWYTKLGNTIMFGGTLRLTSKGTLGASDWIAIGGFPFLAKASATPYGEKRGATALGQVDGLDGGVSGEVLVMFAPWQGTVYANLKFNRYGETTATTVLGPDITDTLYINSFSGLYVVD